MRWNCSESISAKTTDDFPKVSYTPDVHRVTMATRNETLMIARQITADAPVSQVQLTVKELESPGTDTKWCQLRAKWHRENEHAVARRKQLAREAVALAYLRAKARKSQPEIVTSAPAVSARKVNPLADTVVVPFEQPFPLCRPILRGKVARRRPTAIGCFFRAVNIFLKG
jgi:hypothetical protein